MSMFDEIQKQMANSMIEPPTIPLDFTKEQIQECKDYAYRLVLNRYPRLSSKRFRMELNPIEKAEVVNILSEFFDKRVEYIKSKTKNTG